MKYVFRVDDFSYYSYLKHCPEQRHSSVYGKLEAEHLQLPAHRFLHLHLISSRQLFDAPDSTVQNGCHATISIFCPPPFCRRWQVGVCNLGLSPNMTSINKPSMLKYLLSTIFHRLELKIVILYVSCRRPNWNSKWRPWGLVDVPDQPNLEVSMSKCECAPNISPAVFQNSI